MNERRADPVYQKIATWLMPIFLAIIGYAANNSFQRINETLIRIELRQSSDQAQAFELRARIDAIERELQRGRQSYKITPPTRAEAALKNTADVYSQS